MRLGQHNLHISVEIIVSSKATKNFRENCKKENKKQDYYWESNKTKKRYIYYHKCLSISFTKSNKKCSLNAFFMMLFLTSLQISFSNA